LDFYKVSNKKTRNNPYIKGYKGIGTEEIEEYAKSRQVSIFIYKCELIETDKVKNKKHYYYDADSSYYADNSEAHFMRVSDPDRLIN
jgi:hypothetical protein